MNLPSVSDAFAPLVIALEVDEGMCNTEFSGLGNGDFANPEGHVPHHSRWAGHIVCNL